MTGHIRKLARLGRKKAREWDLVLQAMGIPHRFENTEEGVKIRVAPSRRREASRQIKLYEQELSGSERYTDYPRAVTALVPSLAVFLAIYLFHFFISVIYPDIPFRDAGAADSAVILSGEWWRLITALTLHADLGHVLSNLILLAVIGGALGGLLGPGWAYLLVLVSGMGGNILNALVHQSAYSSIGASTAVFGAAGILGAMQVSPRYRHLPGGALGPFAAAAGLLAFLGMGEHTDIGGHVFGFLSGTVLGLLAGFVLPAMRKNTLFQVLAGIAAVTSILAAWFLALR